MDHVFDFREPWLSIGWNSECNCVYAEFKAFATSTELRTGSMAIIESVKRHRAAALVLDNRGLEVVTSADQLWIRDTWTPQAVEAGLHRIAIVLPHHGLGKYATEAIRAQIGPNVFMTRTFSDSLEALAWVAAADK
jgi:hypothetical protein